MVPTPDCLDDKSVVSKKALKAPVTDHNPVVMEIEDRSVFSEKRTVLLAVDRSKVTHHVDPTPMDLPYGRAPLTSPNKLPAPHANRNRGAV